MTDLETYKKAYLREKEARRQIETLLETKTRELYLSNQDLQQVNQQLKDQQRNLVKTEKLVALGTLSAGVAHEVNNPLSFIKSNLNTLQRYLGYYQAFMAAVQPQLPSDDSTVTNSFDGQDPDYINNDTSLIFEEVTEGIERVSDIVTKLKRFSRTQQSDLETVDLNELINTALTITLNEVKYKCELVLELSELPATQCNPNELTQVFINLIINAAQAIAKQGTITIKSWFEPQNDHLCISVADTGCGIPEEHIDQIFTPFFTAKPIGQGTGLGLSVSYGLIDELGGSITVSSKEGVGTTFLIRLPKKSAESSE